MVKVWDFYGDEWQKPRHTIATTSSVSGIAWRPLKHGTTELATCGINIDHRVHVWDLKRPFIPTRIMDEHESTTTGIQWKDDSILFSCSKDMTFVQNDVTFAYQPINSLTHSAFSWGPTGSFTFAAQQRRTRRNASRGFDSEDDLQDRRRYGRSSSFRASRPVVGGLETHDSKIVQSQAIASVTMPGLFDEEAFGYLAEGYVFDLAGQMGGPKLSLGVACEINARAAWEAQKYRTAQTWKMLRLAINREDREIEKERQAKSAKTTASTGVGGSSSLTVTKAPGLSAEQGNPSAGATPLVQPVADLKNTTAPAPGEPGVIDEAFLAPPAVFAASLGSSPTSTDGEGFNGVRTRKANGATVPGHASKPRPMLNIATATGVEVKPALSGGVSSGGAIGSMESAALFSPSTDYSPPNIAGIGPMDMKKPNPDKHSRHHAQHDGGSTALNSSGSYPNGTGRENGERKFLGMSGPNDSSYEAGIGGFGGRTSEEEEDEVPTVVPAGPWSMEAIQEEVPAAGSGQSVPESRVPENMEGEGVQSEEEREAKPWSPQKIMEKIVEWYCENGDVQMCATLVLLLADRIKVDERRAEEWVEGYIRMSPIPIDASEAVRLADTGGNRITAEVQALHDRSGNN